MLNAILKAACLATYALALAALAGLLPEPLSLWMKAIAGGLLLVHALELLAQFKTVRRYRGSLAVSVLLTLLFGLLHWKPLEHAQSPKTKG